MHSFDVHLLTWLHQGYGTIVLLFHWCWFLWLFGGWFLIGLVPIVLAFDWCWFICLLLGCSNRISVHCLRSQLMSNSLSQKQWQFLVRWDPIVLVYLWSWFICVILGWLLIGFMPLVLLVHWCWFIYLSIWDLCLLSL